VATSDAAPTDADQAGILRQAGGAYVVQIGAYREQTRAQRAARELDMGGLVIMPTRRADEDWFVLLLGAYPSSEAAEAAGRAFVESQPRGSYWVRSAAELRRILRE
jgi:septal ring-binding cell division protein DamX